MGGIFFYTIGICFVVGIFARSFISIGFPGIVTLLALSGAFFLLWRQKTHRTEEKNFLSPFFLSGIAILFFALGVMRLEVTDSNVSVFKDQVGADMVLEGVIVREPDVRENTVHLYTKIHETDEIILVTTDRYRLFSYGDEIQIEGKLTAPEAFETDLGRTFNYPEYLKARGVTHTISFAEVLVLSEGNGNGVIRMLLNGKKKFTDVIEGIIPEPEVGLGEGLLLGMKRALGENLEEAFRRTGIIHIVVLSGYNVMIVAEAVMRLLSFFFAPRTRIVIGVVVIALFALLVGLSATVVRASIMACFVLTARATGRIYAVLRGLMVAGIIMLLFNPYLLAFDPGFQLSFLATLGLIFLAPLIEKSMKWAPTTLQIREFITATIATQIFVSPLLLYLMGSISVIAIIVNVLVLPAVPIAMFLTFIVGMLGFLSISVATFFGFGAHIVLLYITSVAELFSRFSYATFDITMFPFWIVVLIYAVIGSFIYKMTKSEEVIGGGSTKTDLSGWTIEEEKPADVPEVSGTSAGSLPFR